MQHTLAIDPSLTPGWALLKQLPPDADGNPRQGLFYGRWSLGEGLSPGGYFKALCEALTALCKEHGIAGDLQIVIEDKSLNSIGTAWSKHLAESWVGVVETWCEVRGLPAPISVGVNSWRSAFIGRSQAPKEVTGSEARRKWVKAAVLAECKRRGLNPTNDDESDAIGCLFWFVNGGVHVQQQRRANKVARTKAKRAQKKLQFEARA